MSMKDIAARISVVDDIHITESLKEQLQRSLTKNAMKIAEYLLFQEQRLFNAIVVGSYGGQPRWHEVGVRSRSVTIPAELDGALGFLELSGDETLFAVDGQHRVVGIKEAITRDEALKTEEVPAIFVQGVSSSKRGEDPAGFERTRRLFSTLNRYAKPVQKRDIIALDEDDVVAIVTRRLVEQHRLLIDKVAMNATTPLSANDRTNLTTLVALYDALDIQLRDRMKGWKDFKRERPAEREVNQFHESAKQFVDTLCRHFKPLREVRDNGPEEQIAGKFRDAGHVLFRPVGLLVVTRVIRHLQNEGATLTQSVRRLAEVPMDLRHTPWVGLLWDPVNERMITTSENQRAARQLIHYAVGGDPAVAKYTKEGLREELAGLLKKDISKVKLPRFLPR